MGYKEVVFNWQQSATKKFFRELISASGNILIYQAESFVNL